MIDRARLLNEVLTLVAPGEHHTLLVGEALRNAGEIEVPQDPEAFRRFAEGPVRHAATNMLGEERARALVSALLALSGGAKGTLPLNTRNQERPAKCGATQAKSRTGGWQSSTVAYDDDEKK